jgi:NTP pyrophosphatase (non-canonical NTP hydrolase)
MKNITDITKRMIAFRDARDWKQFHTPKDCAVGLVLEATEVLEQFQYMNTEEVAKHIQTHKEDIADELADVMYWVLIMAHDLKIDMIDAVDKKITKTEKKYPIEKAKGNHIKYNKL